MEKTVLKAIRHTLAVKELGHVPASTENKQQLIKWKVIID
jgi:hypothetical protein